MTAIEVFFLIGAGYISGLAVLSGFVMRWILHWFVQGQGVWRQIAWSAWMLVNTLTATVIPMLLIAQLVVGNQPGRPDFWPRLALFAVGLLIGMTFVLGSGYVFDRTAEIVRRKAS